MKPDYYFLKRSKQRLLMRLLLQASLKVTPVEEVLGKMERQEGRQERQERLLDADTPSPSLAENIYRSCVKGM